MVFIVVQNLVGISVRVDVKGLNPVQAVLQLIIPCSISGSPGGALA